MLGSQAIASSYINGGKSVKAMLQLDMTAYFKPGTKEVIAVVTDYVDAGLNTWVTIMHFVAFLLADGVA